MNHKLLCICCQTYPVMISRSFCSRICQELWLRSDLQFMSPDQMKRMALLARKTDRAWYFSLRQNFHVKAIDAFTIAKYGIEHWAKSRSK